MVGLDGEREEQRGKVAVSIGSAFSPMPEVLPKAPSQWPAIPAFTSDLRSAEIRVAEAEREAAGARLSSARAQAKPDLKIGPSFERDSAGSFDQTFWGANAGIGLPLFSRNQGGVRFAEIDQERSGLTLENAQRAETQERNRHAARYAAAVKALGQFSALRETESAHEQIERLFSRGLIPVAILLEEVRQRSDFQERRNTTEQDAIESLLRVRALENRLFEEPL